METEEPLRECQPISMSFSSPTKKQRPDLDTKYLAKQEEDCSPDKRGSGGKRLPKSPVKRMRKLEQEAAANQVDVETAYAASSDKVIRNDSQIEEPEAEVNHEPKSLFGHTKSC